MIIATYEDDFPFGLGAEVRCNLSQCWDCNTEGGIRTPAADDHSKIQNMIRASTRMTPLASIHDLHLQVFDNMPA